jgi:hypothetical protein
VKGYKDREATEKREQMLEQLIDRAGLRLSPQTFEHCAATDHALDDVAGDAVECFVPSEVEGSMANTARNVPQLGDQSCNIHRANASWKTTRRPSCPSNHAAPLGGGPLDA